MKILVTGCNGQVGHSLVKNLKPRHGHDISLFAFDREQLDITSEPDVMSQVKKIKPDFIINAAAYTAVDQAETDIDSSYAINRDGPLYLARAAEAVNAMLLHISTDYVFAGDKSEPYIESDMPSPKSVYGQSKLAGEEAVTNNCTNYVILRTSWVFGEHSNNFVKTMMRLGRERSELSIIGDQFGGPTYAGDIAKALITIIERFENPSQSGIYHFAGEPHVSWYQFTRVIFEIAEYHRKLPTPPVVNEITTEQYPLPASRPSNSRLDCFKLNKEFGIQACDWKLALNNIIVYI